MLHVFTQLPDLVPVNNFSQEILKQDYIEYKGRQPDNHQVEPVGIDGKGAHSFLGSEQMCPAYP